AGHDDKGAYLSAYGTCSGHASRATAAFAWSRRVWIRANLAPIGITARRDKLVRPIAVGTGSIAGLESGDPSVYHGNITGLIR
ncbi:MAG: hypothetical protein WCC64_07540, partial [Aliidongia sp.]